MDDETGDPLAVSAPVRDGKDPPRVLVVDDLADQADSLAMLLELSGYSARSAHSARQALEMAREYRPHAAVIDLKMPGIDGFELARQLRQPGAERPILIALTGLFNAAAMALAAGCDRHLLKPLALETLLSVLSEVLPRTSGSTPDRAWRPGAFQVAIPLLPARPAAGIIFYRANDEPDTGEPAR